MFDLQAQAVGLRAFSGSEAASAGRRPLFTGSQNVSLRVQVPKYRVSTPNHDKDSRCRNSKYPVIGYIGIVIVGLVRKIDGCKRAQCPWSLRIKPISDR